MAMVSVSDPTESQPAVSSWKVFAVLMMGAFVGTLGLLPLVAVLLRDQAQLPDMPIALLLALSMIQPLVLAALASGLGLWLGGKIGLGAPLLAGLLAGSAEARDQLRAALLPSVFLGIAAGTVIILLDLGIFSPLLAGPVAREAASDAQSPWVGLLASFYGGIVEEILLRLGLLTVLAWLGTRLARAERPGSAILWGANIVAALLFGLGHLPVTASLMPVTGLVVVRALLLNGIPALVFGWLYMRRGLLPAMIAHFSVDILLHVAAPIALG